MSLASIPRALPLAKAIAIGLIACVLCSAGGIAVGAWLGSEWRKGREAQADNADLRVLVDDFAAQAEALRQRGVDIAQDFRTAHRRMESIVESSNDDRETLDALFAEQRETTEAWLATRLDLYDCRIGSDGVRAWNAAASAGAADTAATGHPRGAAGAVPGEPAAAARGSRAGDDHDAAGEREAVPQLPLPTATHGGGGAGI